MDNYFTKEIKDIIALSKSIALDLQNDFIGTNHLVIAIIKHGKNSAFTAFFEGLSLIKDLENITAEAKSEKIGKILHLTRQSERALKTTFLEAKLFNSNEINSLHLLLCILRNENDPTTKFLNKNKFDYDSVKEKTKEILKEENEEIDDSPSSLNLYGDKHFLEYSTIDDKSLIREVFINAKLRTKFLQYNVINIAPIKVLKINNVSRKELNLIKECITLEHLSIYSSNLKTTPFLLKLTNLIVLELEDCNLSNCDEIEEIKGIKRLNISKNKLTNIGFLKNLKEISFLDISFNQIKNISHLTTNLNDAIFFFAKNKIQVLNKQIIDSLFDTKNYSNTNLINSLKKFNARNQEYENAAILRDYELRSIKNNVFTKTELVTIKDFYIHASIENNPIQTPPPQIIFEGPNHVKDFFSQVKKDKNQTYLYESKLLVIGEGGTGKTSFCRKMEDIKASLPNDKETTFNIDVKQVEFNISDKLSSRMFINIWDFGGQKIYRGTHQLFFSNKCLYVLVDDSREEKTDFSYWLNAVQQTAGIDSKLIIVLNEKHGRKHSSFDEYGYKKQFNNLNFDVIRIDLLKDEDSLDILKDIVKVRFRELPLIGNPLPTSWVDIRGEISKIADNFISYDRFVSLCNSHSITDNSIINTLCSYFDNIGVFTHYDDDSFLKERIYLNSNWLVETVYEVLDNEIIENRKGIVSNDEINRIWKEKDLEFEFDRLCALMNKFGLMYYSEESSQFVIPEKLPKEMPYEKWEYNDEIILKFRYEFEKYHPKGLMSKLIVSLNKYITNHKNVWHRGLNVEFENTFAEIIETYSTKNRFEIRIAGENKNGLLAIIRDKFDEILKRIKIECKKYVQCNCHLCELDPSPHFFEHKDLLRRRAKGINEIECQKEYNKVDVNCILLGIEKPEIVMKKIEIFLASSSELKKERNEIEIFINRENNKLVDENIYLKLNVWEDFIDSMSQTRLQDEYNKVAMNSDIFLSMFSTKVGMFTEEEFENVHSNFIKNGNPKYIYTFFKNEKKGMNDIIPKDFESLTNFQGKLKSLGHYKTDFEDANDLIKQIKLQLDKIIPKLLS